MLEVFTPIQLKEMPSKSQYVVNKKDKLKNKEPAKKPINKKILAGVIAILVFTLASSIYSLIRTMKNTGSDKVKSNRPSIADVEIPREVMDRVSRLKNTQDRENIIKEWAES